MLIDMHGHVTAPPELEAYHASLLSSRGAHGLGKVNVSDERIENVLRSPTFGPKSHLEHLKSGQIDLQLISPRPFSMMQWKQPERLVHWFTEETNNIISRQCKLHPEVFRGVAGLPQSPGVSPRNCIHELGKEFVQVMGNKNACLLLGHGMTTAGKSVEEATAVSLHLFELARMNYMAYAIGVPKPVPERDILEYQERWARSARRSPESRSSTGEPSF